MNAGSAGYGAAVERRFSVRRPVVRPARQRRRRPAWLRAFRAALAAAPARDTTPRFARRNR
jgi:hypothetical protein